MIQPLASNKIRPVAPLIARSALVRKTQPNTRAYVSRMGYNTACTSYTQGIEIGRWSGSSLNRLQSKKRKDEFEKLSGEPVRIAGLIGGEIGAHIGYELEINNLRRIIQDRARDRKRVPKSLPGRALRVHVLSPRSKGKLKDKCTAFFRACPENERTFCTLTFIRDIDDRAAVSILNKFFTQLREDSKSEFKYIWVAERQNKNKLYPGNIHFHIIVNMRLEIDRYNPLWILQQYNAGIEHPKYTRAEILQRYEDKTLGEILNPFDIEPADNINLLSLYLTKYITKNQSDGFDCLAWHCSRSVSKLFTKTIVSRSCMAEVQSDINIRINKKGVKCRYKERRGAFYDLFYIENRIYFLRELSEIEQINIWILDGFSPDKIPEIDDFDIGKFYSN